MTLGRPPFCSSLAFETRYRDNPDPWNFSASAYERSRFRAVMEALPKLSYARAFEPGCSGGELTAQLAEVCGHLLATDFAPSAVARAARRCATLENVEFRCADLAVDPPAGSFDLVVFSEIGYYFPAPLLRRIALRLAGALNMGGDFVAVHWLGQSEDHVLHGDAVHRHLLASLPLRWISGERHRGFRIDSWRRAW